MLSKVAVGPSKGSMGLRWLEDLGRDVALAIRMLRRSRGFAVAAVVSLALGIGAASAIFSVVNAVLLRPLAYRDPERLVVVWHGGTAASPSMFLEWRARARALDRVGAAEYWSPNLAGPDRTEQIVALHVSSDILPLLGVEPMIGRTFTAAEEHAGSDRVVVIGYRFWKNRLAADPEAVGRPLTLDGERYTIVGVMPESFQFAPFWATKAELWAPLVLDARIADKGASLRVFARLKADESLPRARAAMSELTAAIEQVSGSPASAVTVTPLLDMVVGEVKAALLILLAASGLVLVIAGTNVAHLQLVRAAGRERELAVRAALGASRVRVVRQLVTEGLVLAAAGAAAGLALTYGTVRMLVALAPPSLPRIAQVSVDERVVLFALGATLVAAIVFGLAPAIRGTRFDVSDSLKSGGRGAADRGGRSALRQLLIVSEFSMAMVLLAAAALIVRSFFGLLAVDSGFDPHRVSAMDVSVTGTRSALAPRRAQFFQQLVASVRALPGVQAASAINHLPLVGDIWRFSFAIEGRTPVRQEERPSATYRVVLPGYFETMRISIMRGRDFTDRDTRDGQHVVVINEHMARRYWPDRNPIGERLAAGNLDDPDWCTIVGVVRTVKQTTWSEAQDEELYFPYLQTRLYLENPRSFATYLSIVARTAPGMPPPFSAIDAVARSLEPEAVVANPTTVEQAIASEFVAPRFYMLLVGLFAVVAVVLAAVGIYGVMSQAVASRTREIGVRVALGASAREIVGLVMASGLRLAVAGSLIGVAGAVASAGYLRALLFGVEPTDPATLATVALTLIGVACAASYIPARRAIAVDPMTAVRSE
jgi:putative ABC transport system permease protein